MFLLGYLEKAVYLETLQHHLNLGVFYCAGVINYIKNSYTGCQDGISKEVAQYIEKLTVKYVFMWMMA